MGELSSADTALPGREMAAAPATDHSSRMADLMLELVATSSPDVVFYQDCSLRYTLIRNPTSPFSVEQVLGRTDADLLCAAEAERLTAIKTTILKTGASHREVLSLSPGREPRWFDVSFAPARDQTGAIIGVVGYARDVTEFKQAQDALEERSAAYRGLLDSVDSLVIAVDVDGRIRFLNDAALAHLGGAAAAPAGRLLRDFLPSLLTPNHLAAVRQAIAEDRRIIFENRLAVAGELRWYRTAVQPVRDEQGRIVHGLINATDIHDLKCTEQQLVELNQTLEQRVAERTEEVRDLYDNALVGYHSLDAEGRILLVNQTELDWYGYSREEMVGRRLSDFLSAASRAAFDRNFLSFKEHGFIRNLEYEVVCKDGSLYPVVIHSTALYDAAGAFRCSRSTTFDATALRRADAQLRFQADLLSKIAQSVAVTNMDGQIIYWNAAAEKLFGWASDEAIGRKINDIATPNMSPEQTRDVAAALRAGQQWSGEYTTRRRDGSLIWLFALHSPIQDDAGRLQGVIGIGTDISARKQAERILAESHAQNRLLFEEAPDALMLLNREGVIVRANRACEEIIGIGNQEVVGRSAFDLSFITAQTRRMLRLLLVRVFTNDELFLSADSVVHTITAGTGFEKTVESRVFPLQLSGVKHILISSRDITSHRQAQEAMRVAAKEVESALRLKDEFLTTMSHELRTPLNSILTLSEVLQEQKYGPLNERQLHSLSIIEASGRHLLSLINDVLDLSKIEAGRLEPNMECVRADDACVASLAFIREMAHKKSIGVHYDNGAPDAVITADPRRLKQMLVNLLSNAVKFTPARGQVRLDVRVDTAGRTMRFAVCDTGIGIAAADMPMLFQPFTQIDSALTREFDGTGLGLALVKRLALQHGGDVHAESAGVPGQGSCFTLVLPYHPPVDRPDPSYSPRPAR